MLASKMFPTKSYQIPKRRKENMKLLSPFGRGMDILCRLIGDRTRSTVASNLIFAIAIIALCVACFESYSGEDLDLEGKSVISESFSPFDGRLKDDDSAAEQLWWKYRINQGKPLTTSMDDGVSTLIEFDDQLIVIDPSEMTRSTTVEARIRTSDNSQSGTIAVEETVNLEIGQTTRLISQRMIVKTNATTDRGTVSEIRDLRSEMDPPMEWVLDRNDLDESDPGDILHKQTYEIRVSGSVDSTIDGQREIRHLDAAVSTATSVWTVVDKHESLSVQGNDYANVIEIQFESGMFSSEDSEDVEIIEIYWVAKRVGIVKSISTIPLSNLTGNIPIELVDTNLVQEM
jgi:hypothetical protein